MNKRFAISRRPLHSTAQILKLSLQQHYLAGVILRLVYHLAKPCISGEGILYILILYLSQSQSPTLIHTKYVHWLSGVCGHSNKHTPGHIPEVQCAFKDLMIHESCRSHYVSHFAAFFIVVGAKTSVAESVVFVLLFGGLHMQSHPSISSKQTFSHILLKRLWE